MDQKQNSLFDRFKSKVTPQNLKYLALYPVRLFHRFYQSILSFYNNYPKTAKSLLFLALLSFGALGLLYKVQNNLLYFPQVGYGRSNETNPQRMRHPSYRNIESQDIQLTTDDNVILRGWHLKKNGAKKLIVYFHGNAGNIGTRLPLIQAMMDKTNSQVLIVGYRGYSDSQGSPSQRGLELDSQAILSKAQKIAEQRNLSLFIFGTSLGGAVGVYAAGTQQNRNKLSGLILQNTFTGTTQVLTQSARPLKILSPLIRLINRNPWYSISRIHRIRCPIFFIKCGRDQIVPSVMTDRLRQQCNKHHIHNYLYEIPDGYHNDAYNVNPTSYFNQLNEFFTAALNH